METTIDKIYKPAVLILLTLLVLIQGYALLFKSEPSAECLAARTSAGSITGVSSQINALEEYDEVVYDKAENINQQIFYTGEFQVLALEVVRAQLSALLGVMSNCD